MKKFLSLALALVMTMSLVTISASADFADDASISYAEAVDVMAELDVIGGYADGSFAPTGTLTRGAAAKIICNMILGPTVAGALGADTAPFPDVPATHTFAGYIAYCVQQGILSGYADGNFYPAGQVTGNQFMKMLLGALGYSSDIEGFTGANWSVNVTKLAMALGLEDGNDDFVGTAAMTREEACLYALNAMESDMVEYPNNTTLVVGDISITTSSNYSAVYNKQANDYRGYGAGDEVLQFCEKYFGDLEKDTDTTDAFGSPAVAWEYDNDGIGTYVNYGTLAESFEGKVTKDDIYDVLGKSLYNDIADGDVDLTVWVDGVEIDDVDYADYMKSASSSTVAGRGSYTDVFVDGDDNTTIVIVNTYLVQAADDYDDDDEKLKIAEVGDIDYNSIDIQSSIANDDVNVEGFEDDDYILVTIADEDIQTAVLAETVTGAVSTFTLDSSVTIDGEKYYYSCVSENTAADFAIAEDTVVVLDDQGNIIYIDDVVVNSDRYVFIDDFDYSSSFSSATIYAAAFFSDGTYAEIEVDEIYGKDAAGDDALDYVKGTGITTTGFDSKWYTYTTNSDGSYDLTQIEDKYALYEDEDDEDKITGYDVLNIGYTDENTVISSGSVTFTYKTSSKNMKGDSETVFVIVDADDDVYMYTGVSNVADVYTKDGQTASVYGINVLDGGYADFVFVDARYATVDGASEDATDYMFVLNVEDTTRTSDDDVIYDYNVLIDGEDMELSADSSVDDFDKMTGKLFYNVTVDSKGYIDGAKDFGYYYGKYSSEEYRYAYTDKDGTLERSGDVVSFTAITGMDFIFNDDSVAYVIVAGGDDNAAMLADDNAGYEFETYTSAKSLANDLEDYTFTADVYMIADKDGSETIDQLYIYITASEETDPDEDDDGDDGDGDESDFAWKSFSFSGVEASSGTLNATYTGTALEGDELLAAIYAELVDMGAESAKYSEGKWSVSIQLNAWSDSASYTDLTINVTAAD